jgi:CysZ protein
VTGYDTAMWSDPSASPFAPVMRALAQLDDPAFLGVLVRSVAWSVVCFAALHVAAIMMVHHLLNLQGWLAWTADILGAVGASLLAFWLFLPVAAAIGTLYFDRIAFAVERRHYPWLPPPAGAPLTVQAWDGISVALRVLALNIVALVLALLVPGVGLLLGWIIAGYAIGRGLFVAVAMRRMPREAAESLYAARRSSILLTGGILAAATYVPFANLLIPVIGVAAMVHVLDSAMAGIGTQSSAPTRSV